MAHCQSARRRLGSVLLLVVAHLSAACGGDSAGTGGGNPAQPTPTTISALAKAYLEEIVGIMQAHSIYKKTIDWARFRAEVFTVAGAAQTIPDTYPAIGLALRLLNDYHSFYLTKDGQRIKELSRGCAAATPTVPTPTDLPETVGYVRVPPGGGESFPAGKQFATSLQQGIAEVDHPGLAGWIVDVRGNGGGSIWAMIAGVGPILGDGIAGYAIDADDREEPWDYRTGAFYLGEMEWRYVDAPYTLLREHPRIAVLTDGAVASAAEGVVIVFRGRPATRSFGTLTCGLSTGNEDFNLSDSAILVLAPAVMADRMKTKYDDSIQPDEIVSDPEQVVARAIAWLQGGN